MCVFIQTCWCVWMNATSGSTSTIPSSGWSVIERPHASPSTLSTRENSTTVSRYDLLPRRPTRIRRFPADYGLLSVFLKMGHEHFIQFLFLFFFLEKNIISKIHNPNLLSSKGIRFILHDLFDAIQQVLLDVTGNRGTGVWRYLFNYFVHADVVKTLLLHDSTAFQF